MKMLISLALVATMAATAGATQLTTQVRKAQGTGWSFEYKYPQLTKPGMPKAQLQALNTSFAQDAQKSEAAFKAELNEMFGPTLAAPASEVKALGKSERKVGFNVLANAGVLSLAFFEAQHLTGGPRWVNTVTTRNLRNGAPVKLTDLFKPNTKWLPVVSQSLTQSLKAKGSVIIDAKGIAPVAKNFEVYGFDKKGLIIFLQAGQATSFAEEIQDLTVTWATLRPFLKPGVEQWVK